MENKMIVNFIVDNKGRIKRKIITGACNKMKRLLDNDDYFGSLVFTGNHVDVDELVTNKDSSKKFGVFIRKLEKVLTEDGEEIDDEYIKIEYCPFCGKKINVTIKNDKSKSRQKKSHR